MFGSTSLHRIQLVEQPDLHRRGSGDHRETIPEQQRQYGDNDGEAASNHPDDSQCHENGRKRKAHGDQKQNDVVDGTAKIAAEDSERDSDDSGEDRCPDTDQKNDPRAIQKPCEIIPAELVRSQDMVGIVTVEPEGGQHPLH
jgi:hypothetical protein